MLEFGFWCISTDLGLDFSVKEWAEWIEMKPISLISCLILLCEASRLGLTCNWKRVLSLYLRYNSQTIMQRVVWMSQSCWCIPLIKKNSFCFFPDRETQQRQSYWYGGVDCCPWYLNHITLAICWSLGCQDAQYAKRGWNKLPIMINDNDYMIITS